MKNIIVGVYHCGGVYKQKYFFLLEFIYFQHQNQRLSAILVNPTFLMCLDWFYSYHITKQKTTPMSYLFLSILSFEGEFEV